MSAETARTQTRDSSRRQSLSAIIQTVFGIYPSFANFLYFYLARPFKPCSWEPRNEIRDEFRLN